MDIDMLLEKVRLGDRQALDDALARHRGQLRRMIEIRMDPRLRTRLDPSDVIQETLAAAALGMEGFLRDRPLPFYPWLRQLAWNRLLDLHRRHLKTQKRNAAAEEVQNLPLTDASVRQLAERLLDQGTSPSGKAVRAEQYEAVQRALDQLSPGDREVLVLRYLEKLKLAEIAELMGLSLAAAKVRHFRALERLRTGLAAVEAES